MAIHGKNTVVLVDSGDLSGYFNSSDVTAERDALDKTAFGDQSRKYQGGLLDGSVSLEGFWDGSEDAIDQLLQGYLGDNAGQVMTLALGGTAFGMPADLLKSKATSYNVAQGIGDLVTIGAELQGDEGVRPGVVLLPLTARTATATGTTHDGAAASTGGLAAHLHVTAATGTAPTAAVKVQHSADGTTWTDLVTFTTATGATAERKTTTGTVQRYVRAMVTIGGTNPNITLAVAVARL